MSESQKACIKTYWYGNCFLDKFNGISYMLDIDWTSNSVLQLFTDSAGGSTKGCGCYFQGKWAFLKWPVEWSGTEVLRDISYLEMIPIALSVYLWEIQKSGSDSRYTSSYNSGGILDHFRPEIAKLLDASNSQNTWKTYNNGLTSFVSFRLEEGLGNTWPPSISHLVNYVAYLSKLGYAPATVKVYLSGLSYYLRINELTDLTSSFIIQKMLKGMDKLYGVVDSRKPITLEILARLINSLQSVCSSVYECTLFRSMFSLAFFAFLRIGEITINRNTQHVINNDDVNVSHHSQSAYITIPFSKTDQK
ncbi:Hypothetical predicted protein, partial [Mytilus galloprovincialis]